MTPSQKFLSFCILALTMLACSLTVDFGGLPSSAPPTPTLSGMDQVSTMVAQTLQALTQQARPAIPTETSTPTLTLTPTNTPMPPTLSVSAATNCYAGPSASYGFVITIYPGVTVTVIGKDTADNYWVINVPNYPGTVCWLSGQYASVSGDTSDLPAPATPMISNYTLSEPANLRVSCTSQTISSTPTPWWGSSVQWTVVLRWRNTDPDQTGVRIYRNGHRIATLGPHSTSYTDVVGGWGWGWDWRDDGITYGVQAFNSNEVSSIVTISVYHCN
jgi:hypothetical protein